MSNEKRSYWQNIFMSRVAILGICPPPFGGVSVHINRVMDRFSMQDNALFFWPTERKRFLFPLYVVRLCWWLIIKRPKHLYYHSTYLSTAVIELVLLIIMRWFIRYQLHIVDHDCRHLYTRAKLSKRLYRWVAKRATTVICIGQATKKSYDQNDISGTLCVEDAFIPPIHRNASLIMQTIPSSIFIFIKEYTPILLLSVAHLMRIENKDMYGVDMAIRLLAGITNEYPDAGLIIGLAQIKDKPYFDQLQRHMSALGISERIYYVHENKELWPLFSYVDLFLRPTLTDGDSISVREALYFNVPVVASDVSVRPAGVQCFKTNDLDDAIYITKKTLKEYVYGAKRKRDYLHSQSPQ